MVSASAAKAAALTALVLGGSAAAAETASANASSCAWSIAPAGLRTCFDVQTAGVGNQVSQLVLYRSLTTMNQTGTYKATPLMYAPNGKIIQEFTTRTLPGPVPWDHGIVISCKGLLGGTLPNPSFKGPCHTWPGSGFKLGMRVVVDKGTRVEVGYAPPVEIRNK
jgi:hypothetical protein